MDSNVWTPLKLWEGYNANEPLEPTILKYETKSDNLIYFEAYFTAEYCEDEPLRVFINGYIPSGIENPPSLLYVNDYSRENADFFLNKLARAGYFVATFDYVGDTGTSSCFTHYPKSLSYGNLLLAGDKLNTASPSPKETCAFLWAKICRRALTFMRWFNPSNSTIGMIGYGNGSDLIWQAAAMDGNVATIIPVLNAGWNTDLIQEDDLTTFPHEKSDWLICCTPQSYSKFIKCPVLFLGNTNCAFSSLDKLESTLDNIPNAYEVKHFLTPGLNLNLSKSVFPNIIKWLSDKLVGGGSFEPTPAFSLEERDGKLYAKVSHPSSCKSIKIFYSVNEKNPLVRNWERIFADDYSEKEIPITDNTLSIMAFANIEFSDRTTLSSYVKELYFEKPLQHSNKFRRDPIIYDKKNEGDGFFNYDNEYSCFVDRPEQRLGGLDITGLTVDKGDLLTYRVGTLKYSPKSDNSILQFDAYSEEDRDLVVEFNCIENSETITYSSFSHLKAKEWTRISLDIADFANSSLIPLKTWANIKSLCFKSLKGTLVNNILWI